MKTDMQIQTDVMEELKWEPSLYASSIGVSVKNGIVTLSGIVDAYSKKLAAEKAAKKVSGVKALAEDIQIGVSPSYRRTDTEIAEAVLNILKWHSAVREEKVKIKVEDGTVTLEGEVDWEYQRYNARMAIENVQGVRSVINLIKVKPKVTVADVRNKIGSAFQRNASIDANKITVEVNGSTVTLRGEVRSIAEKEAAEQAAWNAPGITEVEAFLEVETGEEAYAYEE